MYICMFVGHAAIKPAFKNRFLSLSETLPLSQWDASCNSEILERSTESLRGYVGRKLAVDYHVSLSEKKKSNHVLCAEQEDRSESCC